MGADTRASEPKGVGDSANQKIHAIACRHIACDADSLPCIQSADLEWLQNGENPSCKADAHLTTISDNLVSFD